MHTLEEGQNFEQLSHPCVTHKLQILQLVLLHPVTELQCLCRGPLGGGSFLLRRQPIFAAPQSTQSVLERTSWNTAEKSLGLETKQSWVQNLPSINWALGQISSLTLNLLSVKWMYHLPPRVVRRIKGDNIFQVPGHSGNTVNLISFPLPSKIHKGQRNEVQGNT